MNETKKMKGEEDSSYERLLSTFSRSEKNKEILEKISTNDGKYILTGSVCHSGQVDAMKDPYNWTVSIDDGTSDKDGIKLKKKKKRRRNFILSGDKPYLFQDPYSKIENGSVLNFFKRKSSIFVDTCEISEHPIDKRFQQFERSILQIDFQRKFYFDTWFQFFNRPRTQKQIKKLIKEYEGRSDNYFFITQQDSNIDSSYDMDKRYFVLASKLYSNISSKMPFPMLFDSIEDYVMERDLIAKWTQYLGEMIQREITTKDKQSNYNSSNILISNLETSDTKKSQSISLNSASFRNDFQHCFFTILNDYRDIYFPYRNFENCKFLREAYSLHVVNHLLKSKRYVWYNDEKIETNSNYKVKDKGFANGRVLFLLPFRSAAYEIIQIICQITPKLRSIRREEAFDLTFGEDKDVQKDVKKPDWYNKIFDGNIDDNFSFGVALHNGQIDILCPIKEADIIFASPLGFQKDVNENEEFGLLLSSIEICIVDQCDVIFMQNWEHLIDVFEMINVHPESKIVDVDLERVRDYFIFESASSFRQTIMISSYMNPDINSLFNNIDLCNNIRGKIKVRNNYHGVISEMASSESVPQVFERFGSHINLKLEQVDDLRFQYFSEELYPRFKNSPDGIFLVVVSSYLDFVRVRNFFDNERASYYGISEYTENTKNLLSKFHKTSSIYLLYTERHFFFQAPKLKDFKVNQIVFYSLPENAFIYKSMAQKACQISKEYKSTKVLSLFCVFDALKLERIIGTKQCQELLSSTESTHIFHN